MTREFVVIEPDPVICLDLDGLLRSGFGDAKIFIGPSLAEVESAMRAVSMHTTVFARAGLLQEDPALEPALTTAATRGAEIVLIGSEQATVFPAKFVDMPFTNETLIAAIGNDPPSIATEAT